MSIHKTNHYWVVWLVGIVMISAVIWILFFARNKRNNDEALCAQKGGDFVKFYYDNLCFKPGLLIPLEKE